MSTRQKIKVMVVDDHAATNEGVKGILNKNPNYRVVAEALNGLEAIELAKKHRPEMVIMDIRMPKLNGIGATLELRNLFPDIKILIYTMYSEASLISKVLIAGAKGYVLKSDTIEELLVGIDTIYNGELYFSKMASDQLDQEKAEGATMLESNDLDQLSGRERSVLKLLVKGLAPKEISSKLNIAASTVQTHKYNILQKLKVGRVADLYKFAVKHNMVEI